MEKQSPIEWALLPIRRYAEFSGRSSRAEYWWFSGALFVLGFVADAIDGAVGSEIGLLGLTLTLGLIIPQLAVTVRRFHDINRSGWWMMAAIVPAAVFAFQAIQDSLDHVPETASPTLTMTIAMFAFVFACLVLAVFTLLPGTTAMNRYGPDPYNDDVTLAA